MDQDIYFLQCGIGRIRKEDIVGATPPIVPLKEGGSLSHMYLRMVE
jgi:hypothetical protein